MANLEERQTAGASDLVPHGSHWTTLFTSLDSFPVICTI